MLGASVHPAVHLLGGSINVVRTLKVAGRDQGGFSFGLNGKTTKESKIREIREIRVGKFNISHSALKDSITNLSKLAL